MIGDKSRKYQDRGIPPATQSTRLGRGESTYNVTSSSNSSIEAYKSLTASLNTGVIKWLDSRGTALTMNLKSVKVLGVIDITLIHPQNNLQQHF